MGQRASKSDPLRTRSARKPRASGAARAPKALASLSAVEAVERLSAALPVALEGRDPEGVHQLRVACARLATWLHLARVHVLRDDLRWLRKQASAVRDLDVLLGADPPQEVSMYLHVERERARRELERTLDDPRMHAMLAAFALLPAVPRERARERELDLLRRAEKRGERAMRANAPIEDLHALRRAVRRLRYAREWLGQPVKALKEMQDTLGELNDCATQLRLIAECPPSAPRDAMSARLETALAKAREQTRERWHALRSSLKGA
jgi:CHAD domain-containing protein